MILKRITLLYTLSVVAAMPTMVIADQQLQDGSSGKIRIETIMGNAETGIAAFNRKNIDYAETQNLVTDLNIPEIVRFFDCKTVIGQSFMAQTLACPVSPEDRKSTLAHRQNAIKTLVENPELYKQVQVLLEAAKKEEQEIVTLFSDFFMGQTSPELANLELMKKQNPWLYPIFKSLITNPTHRSIGTAINLMSMVGITAGTAIYARLTQLLARSNHPAYKVAAFLTVYCGLFAGLITYQNHKDYSDACEKRNKVHALSQLITIAQKIESICTKHAIENQFKISAIKDAHAVALLKQITHERYKHKNTVLFFTPAVHTFLYNLYERDSDLAYIFACIAELDTYHAIATKILAHQEKNNRFCFVTFVDSTKPVIHTESFWNVLVENPVTNSLHEDNHIILTGPNAGGKTTAIRALLQNIILGQTFGVAAAEQWECSMFDVIHSYLHISDDLKNGLSLFASEVKRAQDILQKIKELHPTKKFFFALDELFTGTAAEEGETCAFNFVQKIAAFDGVQFIYATHFNKLKELGDTDANCKNYKVDAPIKDANGRLIYPFTLSKGANDVCVALDLAKQANLFA